MFQSKPYNGSKKTAAENERRKIGLQFKRSRRQNQDLLEAKGYSAEELAKLTGVSVEDYKVLEQGKTDFSFTFIYKFTKACGVEVVEILEGTSTTLTSFAITRKGEGLKIIKKKALFIIT